MANDPNHDDLQSPEEAETLAQSEAMLARQESDSPSILTGASDPMLNTVVGRYRIKRVIGEGGMGTVYEALQESPRRTVALKMVKHSIHSPNLLRRFEYESQTLGRLKHPNIAQIYEAGTHDVGHGPRPYFVMEYLVGAKPITEYAREKKLNTRDR
ncbi:MAG: protein kinase, partial [Phycisphaerales bacterium]|nr:protein kinase [Phycisphaerales bacterium]